MKEIKTGDRQKKKTSYPCMKMKISKGRTEKEKKKTHHVPMQKWKKSKKGTDKRKKILSLYENENLKRGDGKNNNKKT